MSRRATRRVAILVGFGLAAAVGLALLLWGGLGREDDDAGPESRRMAPDFEVPLLSGADFALSAHRGKTVIIDFWATWCAPCEIQMPVLDTLWDQQGHDDLMVVGVSVDTDPAEIVAAWVDERGLGYPIALGNQELAMRFGVIGFPTLLVIDPAGRIHTQHTGVLSRPELEDILEQIRRETPPLG